MAMSRPGEFAGLIMMTTDTDLYVRVRHDATSIPAAVHMLAIDPRNMP